MESSQDILIALGRLEGKVESLITMQQTTSAHIEELEGRLRQLEAGKHWLMGAAAAAGASASLLISWIMEK